MSLQRPLSSVLCCEGPADELVDGGAVYCVEDNEGQADVHGRMPLGERGGLDGRGRLDGRVELVGRRGVDGRVGLEGHAASPGACTSSAVPMLGVDPARRESDPAESVWFVAGAAEDSCLPLLANDASSAVEGADQTAGASIDTLGMGDDAMVPDCSQRRPGTRHAGGGRPVGTGRRTRSTLALGYGRALAMLISKFGVEEWLAAVGLDSHAEQVAAPVSRYAVENAGLDYNGQVWPLDSVVGAVARFSGFEQEEHGDPEVVATWVALRGNVACTCVRSTAYEAALDPDADQEDDTPCGHASEFSVALERLALTVGLPPRDLRGRLAELTDQPGAAEETVSGRWEGQSPGAGAHGARLIADDVEVFDTGGLPVAVVVSGVGIARVPAPIKCARKTTACCYCDSARASSCTHVQQTRHLRQSDVRSSGSDQSHRRAFDSISQLPISPFDCNRSLQVDMAILDHARANRPYVIDCPAVCRRCSRPRGDAVDEPQEGTILCHNAFCRMMLMGYTCTNQECNAWVSAEGREKCVVISSPSTAASVSLVRHFCHEVAAEGDTFSKVFRTWWRLACGRLRAGLILPSMSLRSQRTASRLMSTGMRLTAEAPPLWPFDCGQCGKDGRIRVVSADGIWLGHLQRRAAAKFEYYSESCLPDAGLLDNASLIPSEWVRRFLRLCLTHPDKPISVTVDQRRL